MYDKKVVRRRRAALAVFVALSIAILTAYFGESSGGLFHTLQRGAQEAFAPVETGASRALKPVRDLFGWVGDTFDAKDENKRAEAARSSGCAPQLAEVGDRRSATRSSSSALVEPRARGLLPAGDRARSPRA